LSEQIRERGFSRALEILEEKFTGRIHLVGGAIRDAFLKRKSIKDLDLIIQSDSRKAALKVAKALDGTFFCLDDDLKTYRVVFHPDADHNNQTLTIDIAQWTAETLIADLRNRDFSINSVACSISALIPSSHIQTDQNVFIDPCQGIADIREKLMKASSPRSFCEDPVRTVRLFRFAAELNFTVHPETLKLCRDAAHLLKESAMERIRDEFSRILSSETPFSSLMAMKESELLPAIFPGKAAETVNDFFLPEPITSHETEWISFITDILSFSENINSPVQNHSLARDRSIRFCFALGKIILAMGNADTREIARNMKLTKKEETLLTRGLSFGINFPCHSCSDTTSLQPSNSLTRELILWGDIRFEILAAVSLWWSENSASGKWVYSHLSEMMKNIDKAKTLIGGREMASIPGVRGPLMGKALETAWTGYLLDSWKTTDEAVSYITSLLNESGELKR
jgi:hypothetical protein